MLSSERILWTAKIAGGSELIHIQPLWFLRIILVFWPLIGQEIDEGGLPFSGKNRPKWTETPCQKMWNYFATVYAYFLLLLHQKPAFPPLEHFSTQYAKVACQNFIIIHAGLHKVKCPKIYTHVCSRCIINFLESCTFRRIVFQTCTFQLVSAF